MPSPQSNRSRSPPRRTSSAARCRLAVGTEPEVPRKTRSRSIAHGIIAPMAESVQGGRLVAQALAAHGVDTIFTLSGGHVMPVYEGCRLEGIRVLDVRHEQAAGHAAEAWGRDRRTAGVALVTAGPGVTGVVTPVANSFAAQTPLVVLGGARPLVQAEQGALQELDQLSLLKPITKWAACLHPDRAHPGVRRDRVPARARAAARAGLPRAADGRALRARRRRTRRRRRPARPRARSPTRASC